MLAQVYPSASTFRLGPNMCAAGRDAPLCRCGERSLTDLRTAELRRRWSDAEGVKWSWVSSGRALWYLCEPCHHQAWPEDGRCNNRHSRPVAQRRDLGYATRLMAGNLSLGLSVLPSVRRSVLCGLVWSLSVSVRLFCVVSSGGSDLVLSGLFCSRLVPMPHDESQGVIGGRCRQRFTRLLPTSRHQGSL